MSLVDHAISRLIGRGVSAVRRPEHRFIAPTREAANRLIDVSDEQLRERSECLRCVGGGNELDDNAFQVQAFALMCEALRRVRGVTLYDVQLHAASVLARGGIAEMQTGEGKTFSASPAAYLAALSGRGVHVATPNAYLAQRDHDVLLPAYHLLGISVGLVPERTVSETKRVAYRCDITYGTGYEFGFDYLRDQLSLRQAAWSTLGERTMVSLAGDPCVSTMIQRGLHYSIVDEADHVLLDDGASPLILSGAAEGEAADAAVHRQASKVVGKLNSGEHYTVQPASGRLELTDAGERWIHRWQHQIPIHLLRRTWTEYVELALSAMLFRRDVHYVVDDQGAVQIVDTGTGRIFSDRSWRGGLHQAVEAKEGLRITPENLPLAQVTRQRFYRLYQILAGMTGTARGSERELSHAYRLRVHRIALRTPSRRAMWAARCFATAQDKWQAIARSVQEVHKQQRPVLVGTRSIEDSERLAELFRELGVRFQLLNGRQDATEAAIISDAGERGAVTIATSLAGRGTDIKLGRGVAELGGLHVVVSECNDSQRIDRQLVGRCVRQGDPGSAQMFISADDCLLQQYGTWLAAWIKNYAGPAGEVGYDFSRRVQRLQRLAERVAHAQRSAMLRRDLSRDSLYSGQPLES